MNPSKALSKLDYIIGRLGKFKPIRAYHGSPHSFSRFDSSKIGTGEGVQAYGHGLYFAGNEDVARSYRDIAPAIVSPGRQAEIMELQSQYLRLVQEGQRISDAMSRIHESRGVTHPGWGDLRSVPADDPELSALRSQLAGVREMTDAAAAKTASAMSARGMRPPRGHMYEVEIGYPEEALLDLDAPVGSQPKAVRDALAEFANAPSHFAFGQEGWRGKDAYMTAAERGASQAEASRFFRDRGIPGLRYWDGGSRAAGEGTRNYVVFPGAEDAITILRKYGFLPPVAAAAAMSEEDQ